MRTLATIAVIIGGLSMAGCVQQMAKDGAKEGIPDAAVVGDGTDPRVWSYMPGMGQLTGTALDAAIKEADKHPLGSTKNPVRVEKPEGQRAYLSRLRCADGRRPDYMRRGNVGQGVFGNIIDLYEVNCHSSAPGAVEVYMDMYFTGAGEQRAVPGFTITQ